MGICSGLNVIEMGSGSIAASMAGMVLADAGAHVIKVEPPDGDALRTHNPSGFLVWNRGKDSVVADLHTSAGQERLRELAVWGDVVIEGFAPDTTRAWGVGAGDLCTRNPRLVHCSITAFGPSGPYSSVKGLDALVAAKMGLWARGAFGYREGPLTYPVPWASFGAAMQAVAGILGALLVRDETGRGQRLDATLFAGLDPIDYFVATIAQLMAKKGEAPSADARSAIAASRYGVLVATKDSRFIQTSTMLPHQAKALSEVAGIMAEVEADPELHALPQFATVEAAQKWEDLLMEAFRAQDLAYWMPKLEATTDIAFELAATSEESLDHPQIVHNGDVVTIEDPVVGPVREVGPIGHFSATPIRLTRSAPALGSGDATFAAPTPLTGSGTTPTHPFSGTTVVEFGYFYAMPYATTMLAALGARVIKIEDGAGDPHRLSFGPDVATNKTTAGKESLSVDLRTAEGRRIAQEVVAKADVFVTGFRSGVAERLGLGEDDLRALNPRLLYVHAAGYGADGPYAKRALYAQAAQAVGGSFGRQVGPWTKPEASLDMSVMELQVIVLPRLGQVVDGDSNAALALLAALALGIFHQRRTGEGQRLLTSMIAGNALAYSDDFCSYAGKPPTLLCDEEYWGTDALNRCYPAAEGSYVCLAVRTAPELDALLATIGLPELATDERFSTAAARAAHDGELIAALGKRFADKPAAEWEAMLLANDVGCVEANLAGQPVVTSFDPKLREAGLTVAYEHPVFGEMVRAGVPVAFSETPGRIGMPCTRGEHNRAILAEIGRTSDEIAELEAAGVVIPPAVPAPV